ncbi:serine/threonine protein kinase [Yinghuangia seranimata]|uniref:serine/threonine protein kinase n=1 Tax=Yinghuangia seranimata TaxID=408067 RepID=UPI00248C986D|nr:serine/threonine-protein kinase [Yinghuangia seranimata]MDI2125060.1 protein kinase [Yinghuangia seranimata]
MQGAVLNGRYRLTRRLGGGSMGDVWAGEDAVLGRAVAVKVLKAQLLGDPAFAARFRTEARTLARLSHRGVVAVFDYGQAPYAGGDIAYLVMELVDGEALGAVLAERRTLPARTVLHLAAQILDALAAAHREGIVHRDLKPANLIVRGDTAGPGAAPEVVLADFGIAAPGFDPRLTESGIVLGTAHYQAPEAAARGETTAAVDLYSLGVVLYECLAGQVPFDGDTAFEVVYKHLSEPPPPLPGDVPEGLRALVARALAKSPAARWPDAETMADAVRALLAEGGVPGEASGQGPAAADPAAAAPTESASAAAPGPGDGRAARFVHRRRRILIPAATALLLTGTAATVAVTLSDRGHPQRPQAEGRQRPDPVGATGSPGTAPPATPPPASKAPTGPLTNPPPAAPGGATAVAPGTTSPPSGTTADDTYRDAVPNQLPTGTYTLVTRDGVALDLFGGGTSDGTPVVGGVPSAADAERWYMWAPPELNEPGWLLMNVGTDRKRWLDLDVPTRDVQVRGDTWAIQQVWKFEPVPGGYQVVNVKNASCLTAVGLGKRVTAQTCTTGLHAQIWIPT